MATDPYPSRHGMRAVSLRRSCRIALEKGISRAPVPEFLPFWQPGKALGQRGEALGDSSGQNRRPPVDGLRWWSGFSSVSLSESNVPGLAKPRPAKPSHAQQHHAVSFFAVYFGTLASQD